MSLKGICVKGLISSMAILEVLGLSKKKSMWREFGLQTWPSTGTIGPSPLSCFLADEMKSLLSHIHTMASHLVRGPRLKATGISKSKAKFPLSLLIC